ncbi:oocyte zinc finger protein XlCOF6 isoform X2 [Kryptolebias marmoratus]|uniref:Oocyte zinc finger protein XlCOF6-like n=1 Tax=Kryptolebias marmoratus TaxID=37003 RepID=A0A3Q3AI74_KRYMA|nr:oocyte zinc finger protein XlCOF6 isoform X2 [Kryptolebias marmoratus]
MNDPRMSGGSDPMASPLPLSSLRLLIPPLRLLTAAMWQVTQQRSVKHYGMLEDFVSVVTEAVPQLLTDRQRGLLLLALRAKVTLCDPADAQTHLNQIRAVSETTDEDVNRCCSALLTLTNKLTEMPADARRLLLEVFDQSFDSALQSLISDFLSRIEQLFPVPDFRQAASWLDGAPAAVEDFLQDRKHLRELLTNQSCRLGQATTAVSEDTESTLLFAWSHPFFTKATNPEPPSTHTAAQSDTLPDRGGPLQVKVEVVVTVEEEEAVIGLTEQEASNQSSDTPEVLDRLKDSPGNCVSQSEGSAEGPAGTLYSISHNSQRVAHRCPQCGKCFIYRSQVIRHLRSNRACGSVSAAGTVNPKVQAEEEPRPPEPRPVRTHTCFQCSSVFKSQGELLSHQRSHRARPVHQCAQCDRTFQHLSSLTNHRQTHLDKEGFVCSRCNKTFGSAKDRDAHRLLDLSCFVCSVCSQTFSSQTLLLRHLQTHSAEGAELRYSCRFCEQSFSGVTLLRIHQRTHASRSYRCDDCSKLYGSLAGLQSHRATHSSDSRFLCPQCGKRFKTRDGLEGHLRTHTGERPFRCPHCPKDFTALAGLNVHVRQHTGERPYVCTVCGKGWPSGGDLQKHMRTHTGERPYVCQDCGKAFSISCHLTEHRRIHTGEKPFCCPECGKCLRRKFDLKKHILSHSNVRPFACVLCSKSYTRQTHLNRHLLTHRAADGGVLETETETSYKT